MHIQMQMPWSISDVTGPMELDSNMTALNLNACKRQAEHCTLKVKVGSITITNPQLWWPAGYGKPHLYSVAVRRYDRKPGVSDISVDVQQFTELKQQLSRNIGIRTVELIQDPISSTINHTQFAGHGTR